MRTLSRITRRGTPARRPDVDHRLRADIEHLAEVVAETIGRLHTAGRGDIAGPLEAALARLGRSR